MKLVTGPEAAAELYELGVEEIRRGRDTQFFCPSYAWVKEFSTFLKRNAGKYLKQKYDCEDFSIWMVHSATNALVANNSIKDCGHLVCYTELKLLGTVLNVSPKTPGSRHANGMIRCDTDEWFQIEPQNGLYEKITGIERDRVLEWVWL